jgi:MFS transporter, DHA1 family, multidrug resistance protein
VVSMSLTVSLYFVGFALGQILYGPFLDRFGRKPPLYLGLAVYVLGNLGCMFSGSLEALLGFRLLSALGGSAASVAALTMVRDFFPASQVSQVFSMLMLVLSVSPLLAPSVGSILVTAWGWRFLFGVLIALAACNLAVVAWLPVGYEPDRSVSLRLKPVFRTFRSIFHQPQFKSYALAGSLSFAGLFVYVAASPGVFMEGFGLTARQFGAVFAFMTGGMILGGQLNRLFLKRMDNARLFRASLRVQTALSCVFLAGSLAGLWGLAGTLCFVFAILLCSGITSPNASTLAVAPFTRNVGSASALFEFLELGLGALASAGLALLKVPGELPMAVVMAVCSAAAWVILRFGGASRSSLGP